MSDDDDVDEVVRKRLRAGASLTDVMLELIANGYERDEAREIVNFAQNDVRDERAYEREGRGNVKMLFGACLFLLGAGTMVYTYLATMGGIIAVPGGLMIVGAYLFFDGKLRV
jgi:hypothetical protein